MGLDCSTNRIHVQFCLLITFANSFDSDQAQQNSRPGLEPNCLTLMVFLNFFFKVDFEKKSADDKNACKITQKAKKKNFYLHRPPDKSA